MISLTQPQPLRAAVDSVSSRTPLGTSLRSAELESLPVDIRQRAFFSSAVEETRLLERMQRDITRRLQLERRVLADGSEGTFQRRDQFLAEMQELAQRYGLRPKDERFGTLEDIGSFRRLRLIWNMQVQMAQSHAEWVTGQDPDVLDAVPAQEFKRLENRREPRNWIALWREMLQELGSDTRAIVTPEGRMIALKSDPIWTAISRFDLPYAPFDYNSGMGVRNVRRREAERLGVMDRGEEAVQNTEAFNNGLEASMKGVSLPGRERLQKHFGDLTELNGDNLKWRGDKLDAMIDRAEQRMDGAELTDTTLEISLGETSGEIVRQSSDLLDLADHQLRVSEEDLFRILATQPVEDGRRAITRDDFWHILTAWRNPSSVIDSDRTDAVWAQYQVLGDAVELLIGKSIDNSGRKILNLISMIL